MSTEEGEEMTREQAERIRIGDTVVYRGRECQVAGIRVRGMEAPYYRLTSDRGDEGMTSWRLCQAKEERR